MACKVPILCRNIWSKYNLASIATTRWIFSTVSENWVRLDERHAIVKSAGQALSDTSLFFSPWAITSSSYGQCCS